MIKLSPVIMPRALAGARAYTKYLIAQRHVYWLNWKEWFSRLTPGLPICKLRVIYSPLPAEKHSLLSGGIPTTKNRNSNTIIINTKTIKFMNINAIRPTKLKL